jgi:uncharacterized small protein (TIGR04563 family)
MSDKRKQSLYFSDSMLSEIKSEAIRLDRSISWIMQRVWLISKKQIKELKSMEDSNKETCNEQPSAASMSESEDKILKIIL